MSVENQRRKELAAAFRWAARLNMHEAVANHFSMAISDDGQKFIVNRAGTHFSQATASGLVAVDTSLQGDSLDYGVDPTAWVLHSYLHRNVPHAKCVLHTHMPYTTALACLKDFEFLMLDQNACAFYGRIAYDRHYAGMALDPSEGERIASLLVDGKDVLFMGNHGVMVVGETVAQAFDSLYYLEKAAQLEVLALSTHQPLQLVDNETAAMVAKQTREYPGVAKLHFEALMHILDNECPEYAK